jgi:hypothetical protein
MTVSSGDSFAYEVTTALGTHASAVAQERAHYNNRFDVDRSHEAVNACTGS